MSKEKSFVSWGKIAKKSSKDECGIVFAAEMGKSGCETTKEFNRFIIHAWFGENMKQFLSVS